MKSMMQYLSAWCIGMLLLLSCSMKLFGDQIIPSQSQPDFTADASLRWSAAWQGVPGRTYLMEWSDNLVNWNYLPLTESGSGPKNYGGVSSTDKFFVRLAYTDETPDLATATNWEPPLLRIGGEWKVVTSQKSGEPAVGVGISLYLWPASAAAPQYTPLLVAATGTDGTYTFDPAAISTGDRVEVRITGSPNQRVYLPWKEGGEAGDANIAVGGNGLSLAGYLGSTGTGQTPDYTVLPGGNQTTSTSPVYRLEDFLTLDGNGHHICPLKRHEVADTDLRATPQTTVTRGTITDQTNWDTPFFLGWAIYDGDEPIVLDSSYQAQMSVAFGDPALQINVRRNIFILSSQLGGGVMADTLTLANQNQNVTFDDFTVSDLGPGTLPYFPADYATVEEGNMRKLVLGPVPMYVPKSVMGGKPFHYSEIANTRLHAELPLGCWLQSRFPGPPPLSDRYVTNEVKWTATVSNPNDCDVQITDDAGKTGTYGPPRCLISKSNPHVVLSFTSKLPQGTAFQENFTVTVTATARVATTEHAPGEGQAEYTYDYTETDLGSFTTEFKYCNEVTYPPTLAKRQAAELRGLTGKTPEGTDLNGGQRSKTLEPERRIGVNGVPAPGAPTFVDALTGRFHHSETDFSLPVPGSDLSLSVIRTSTDSIWTNAFGLRTTEDPLLAFGPGWDTNLAASLVRVRSLLPEGSEPVAEEGNPRLLKSNITVRDFNGRAYSFLEYTGGDGITSFIPDPTALPERATAGISLTKDTSGNYTLFQPLLGLTHLYQPTSLDFRTANNRDTATVNGVNVTGFTGYVYSRLLSVTDRFGVTINCNYGSNTANLIPDVVSVVGRPALQLRIQQAGGKVQAFWDPAGIKHVYSYANRSLTPLGEGANESFNLLVCHQVGTVTGASYGYQYAIEADPRPDPMLLRTTTSAAYTIPTYHLTPNSIVNGNGDELSIHYKLSEVRSSYSSASDSYYHPTGDPLLVNYIDLPNTKSTAFNFQHTLKYGWPVNPATTQTDISIITYVTDMWGNDWTYSYATATSYPWTLTDADVAYLPTASALFFPELTRSCTQVPNSTVVFSYDASAGFALSQTLDAADRASTATHSESFSHSASPYLAPQISASASIHDHFTLPSTTKDALRHTTTYHYVSNPGQVDDHLPETITDYRGRVIETVLGPHARTDSVKLWSSADGDLLSEVDFTYEDTDVPGAVTKITRKAIDGQDDPEWVTDLVKDIQLDDYGFPSRIGNDTAAIHTTITRSPAGRILSVQSPNGGIRSNIYDSSGLLEASYREDGSNLTYQHDPAGRVVLTRDALGHSTGVEYDSMGRVITAVSDMDGNLGYNPTTRALVGKNATIDIISSAEYLDDKHQILFTDPRGYISVRVLDALGHTTKIIAPANESPPGTVPTDTADYVTTIEYDLSESPTQPVKVTDPLGYETVFKFDEFARLEKILRQYGTNEAENKLYSGTVYGFDANSGLPDSITTIRTPLDSEGEPIDSTVAVQQLTNFITRDRLDRPQTSTFAKDTDKEIQTRTTYTSTGIRYKDETRDSVEPEHWNANEIICDALGRPIKQILPAVIDALTSESGTPTTDILYGLNGQIEQLTDAYSKITSFGYDVLGNLAYKKSPCVEDAKSGQTQEPITIYRYDAAGRLVRMVDPLGYAWSYERDAAGRLTKITGPNVRPDADIDHRRQVWQYFPDPAGNITQVIDPEGHSATRSYYPNNYIATITTPVTFTDAMGSPSIVDVVEQYEWDAMGRMTRMIDGNDQATAFTHDGFGRTLTTTRDPDTARAKTDTTTYDALLPTAAVDAKTQRREFLYNAQFHLEHLNVIDSSTGEPTAESLTYLYDLLGRVTNIDPITAPPDPSMGNPSIARSYDVLGHLQTETSNGVTSNYGYDMLGDVAKVITNIPNTDNSGTTVARALSIQRDAIGRPGRMVDTTNGATLISTFGYDLAGNQVIESMSNGLAKVSDHDPIGRVTGRRIRNADGDVLCRTDYQYDLLSNVTQIKESTAAFNVPNRVIDNTYNERSQLLSETQAETGGTLGTDIRTRSEVHRYDPAENRISSTSATHDPLASTPDSILTRLFEYGNSTNGKNSNQLYLLSETADGINFLTTSYAFDANGNRSTRTIGSAVDTYSYDTFNRLTQLCLNTSSSADNGTYNYTYDPLTRRIATASNLSSSVPHLFAFSGSTPVHEWDTAINNGSLVSNIGGGVGGRLYSQNSIGNVTYPFYNTRGDVIAQFSTGCDMTWHATYTASGLLQDMAGTRVGNYGANGKWEDVSGLVNDGFRYRDRLTNTFITRDPAGFVDGPNDYNYVRHNPWSAWDPNGLATILTVPTGTGDIGYVATTQNIGIPILGGYMINEAGYPSMADTLTNLSYNDDIVAREAERIMSYDEGFHPPSLPLRPESWRNPDGSINWGAYIWEALGKVPAYVAENGWTSFKRNLSDPIFVATSALGGMGIGGISGGVRNGISRGTTISEEVVTAANTAGRTNAQLVQDVATRAEAWGTRQGIPAAGSGPVQGTLKHGYAERLMDRYQSMYGSRGLQTEASYLNGQAVPYGTKGSVRLDVFEPSTGSIWDYKFTPNPSLPGSRVQRIINNGPAGINSVDAVGP